VVDDALVPDDRQDLATVVHVALLGLGDQPLGQRTQALGLGDRGLDPAVLEQLGGEVRQDQPLVSRASAEAGTPCWLRHFVLLESEPAPAV
jgi:hypothetical protein